MLPSFNKYFCKVQTDPNEESGCKERHFGGEDKEPRICFLIAVHLKDEEVCAVDTV